VLVVAALLHESGAYISNRSHHKHSMYLILNSDIFGLSVRDLKLIALVARYHRRALPKPSHIEYASLDREDRVSLLKMAAILRVADALCRGRSKSFKLDISVKQGELTIGIPKGRPLTLEQYALREKGPLFQRVYGMRVMLHRTSRRADNARR